MSNGDVIALKSSKEREASTVSGYAMLLLLLAVIAIGAYLILYTIYFVMVRSRFLSQLKRVMV